MEPNSSCAASQFVSASSCGALLQLMSTGYLFHAEPYCKADTKLSDIGLGQGADEVLGLAKKYGLLNGFLLPFINFLPLFLCLMNF